MLVRRAATTFSANLVLPGGAGPPGLDPQSPASRLDAALYGPAPPPPAWHRLGVPGPRVKRLPTLAAVLTEATAEPLAYFTLVPAGPRPGNASRCRAGMARASRVGEDRTRLATSRLGVAGTVIEPGHAGLRHPRAGAPARQPGAPKNTTAVCRSCRSAGRPVRRCAIASQRRFDPPRHRLVSLATGAPSRRPALTSETKNPTVVLGVRSRNIVGIRSVGPL